jgi:predicted dehydrogenase
MIKAGFIGTGGISGVHLQYLRTQRDVEIAALCDIKPEALKRRKDEFGGEGFEDFRVMLDKTKLDAVWLCTPPWVREEPLLACAERGIAVFCEKPVEHRVDLAAKIARGLARRKGQVQVGYVFRCAPIVQKAREAMEGDRIHLIQSFYGCNVSLTHGLPPWFYVREKSGGAMVDQATHNFDLLRYLFGDIVEVHGAARNPVNRKVAGKYTIDEAIGVILVFASKAVGAHVHTWVGDGWRNEMVFMGEKRVYRLNMGKGQLTVEDSAGASQAFYSKKGSADIGGTIVFEHRGRGIYEYENEAFLNQVRTGNWSANPSSYADALESLRVTVACNEVIATGKPQKL